MDTPPSWFDVFALLAICLMSVAAGMATDAGGISPPGGSGDPAAIAPSESSL
jgi:hypothetical protein